MAKYNNEKVYLEVRDAQSMTEEEKVLLDLSGLAEFAPVKIWSACGTNQQMAYSTHGAFRYFGKFPPPIATPQSPIPPTRKRRFPSPWWRWTASLRAPRSG